MNSWLYQDALDRGLKKGELLALQRALEATLTTRGLKLTPKRREQIERETNADVLMVWIQAAATAERIADVFAAR